MNFTYPSRVLYQKGKRRSSNTHHSHYRQNEKWVDISYLTQQLIKDGLLKSPMFKLFNLQEEEKERSLQLLLSNICTSSEDWGILVDFIAQKQHIMLDEYIEKHQPPLSAIIHQELDYSSMLPIKQRYEAIIWKFKKSDQKQEGKNKIRQKLDKFKDINLQGLRLFLLETLLSLNKQIIIHYIGIFPQKDPEVIKGEIEGATDVHLLEDNQELYLMILSQESIIFLQNYWKDKKKMSRIQQVDWRNYLLYIQGKEQVEAFNLEKLLESTETSFSESQIEQVEKQQNNQPEAQIKRQKINILKEIQSDGDDIESHSSSAHQLSRSSVMSEMSEQLKFEDYFKKLEGIHLDGQIGVILLVADNQICYFQLKHRFIKREKIIGISELRKQLLKFNSPICIICGKLVSDAIQAHKMNCRKN